MNKILALITFLAVICAVSFLIWTHVNTVNIPNHNKTKTSNITLLCSCNPLRELYTWRDAKNCENLSKNMMDRFTIYHNCKPEAFLKNYSYKNGVLYLHTNECGRQVKCGDYVETYEVTGLNVSKIVVDFEDAYNEFFRTFDECGNNTYKSIIGTHML